MEGGEEQIHTAELERLIQLCAIDVPETPKIGPLLATDPTPFDLSTYAHQTLKEFPSFCKQKFKALNDALHK